MFLTAETEVELAELSYETLTRAECIFAALWNSPEGTVGTDAIARYYEVEVEKVLDIALRHHEELELQEDKEQENADGTITFTWTPRGAIRLGMLLNSPIAASVRSLTLDIIEAHKQPSKKAAVRFLLENAQFVEWSNREIGKILKCSHATVGSVRQRLELDGKIVKFENRKFLRKGKEIKQRILETTSATNIPLDKFAVYFVQAIGTNLFKIGHTNDIRSRLKSMSSGCPYQIEVKHYLVCDDNDSARVAESWLHKRFASSRERGNGEWFTLTDEDIRALKDTEICKLLQSPSGDTIQMRPSNPDSSVGEPDDLQPKTETLPDAPVERKFPKEYTEAIAQLKLQHKEEIEQLESQLRAGIQSDAEARAIASVKDQLIASQTLADDKAKEVVRLQQKIDELQSLQLLEIENQRLLQRIQELERSQQPRPGWGNTFTKQAEKVINTQVQKRVEQLEPELHLRAMACVPPTRKMYSEVEKLLDQIRYQMERIPLVGRRVVYEDRYGTLSDIDDNNETAVVDWDTPIDSDTPDDVYRLADIEVLATISGIAQGSRVAWSDVNHKAYQWHGTVVKVYPHTSEVDVQWQELRKTKCCPVSFLRLIVAKELVEVTA